MTACILPYNPASNNKAYSSKNEKHNVSDSGIASMLGGRYQNTKLDLIYNYKEHKILSKNDKNVLRECRLLHPTEFGKDKKIFLDAKKQGKGHEHKLQKKHHINDQIKAQI